MSTTTEVYGREIRGEISRYIDAPKDQRTFTAVLPVIDALLEFPEVEAIRWEQFTRYLNDGDACEFTTTHVTVKYVGDDTSGDSEDGYMDLSGEYPPGYFDTHGYADYQRDAQGRTLWNAVRVVPDGKIEVDYRDRRYYVDGVVREDLEALHRQLNGMINSGEFHVELSKFFGDPSQVTATRDGFDVETYDHE